VTTLTVDNPAHPTGPVTIVGPSGERLPERAPVVLFAHGFGATSTGKYWAWLARMAKQGVWVVFPLYPAVPERGGPGRYEILWAGLQAAIRRIAETPGPRADLERVGFLGHSFGGGAAPAMAARAAARGWGSAAMWIECYAPWFDLDPSAWPLLPDHAYLLSVAYEDDAVCDPATAAGFLAKASTLPEKRKRFVLFRSDARGSPRLSADHLAPLTRPLDALDHRGAWRLGDALRTLAIQGSADAKAHVFGAEAGDLGAWSDGTPVVPPAFAWPPGPEGPKPVTRMWEEGNLGEGMMRGILRAEGCCKLPLPPPSEAPAARLPTSERLVRPAPSGGWPREFGVGSGPGPRLVVLHREGSQACRECLAGIDAAAKDLAERGVAVERIAVPPISPLAERLGVAKFPSVLLFSREGDLLLWREGEEPHLVAAVLSLAKPR
jgi:acetyl esterase/lipase